MRAGRDRHLRAAGRFGAELWPFLRRRMTPERARAEIRARLAARESTFADVLLRGVFANRASPYGPLFAAAGIDRADVVRMLEDAGVEGTLVRLYEAGVRLTLDEFKCRVPVERKEVELRPDHADFDNPLLGPHLRGATSGSSGAPRRVAVDIGLLELEAGYTAISARTREDRPHVVWRASPPGLAGLKELLRRSHCGLTSQAWISPTPAPSGRAGLPYRALLRGTLLMSRAAGAPIPSPQVIGLDRAIEVAKLVARLAATDPPEVNTTWTGAALICSEAERTGLAIAGTHFRVGGEATTERRVAAVERAGCTYSVAYSMAEVGRIGQPCRLRERTDDVHLVSDKLALTAAGGDWPHDDEPRPLVITTLSPHCPKLLINVETGDRARIRTRDCGCELGELGLTRVLSGIESFEKLTVAGMNFTAAQLSWLLETELPNRLGGRPSDFQLALDPMDRSGVAVVAGGIRPGVADAEVIDATLDGLASIGDPQSMMAEQWRQAGAVRVLRRAPYATATGKVHPLHLLGDADQR